eukprot:TRINITY_DN2991_c0_g3_i1.p1 TRINITY_DN2991_c0_g3~~TRINITY_DN2991_c0_g3_i1.p1  ORF type:complete len:349 (+),score=124.51 TRINITY_DN2991_c0_g3_i1:216-1262(+)
MPTFPKGQAGGFPAPMIASTEDPWGLAAGEEQDGGFLKPSEFQSGGYYDSREEGHRNPPIPAGRKQPKQPAVAGHAPGRFNGNLPAAYKAFGNRGPAPAPAPASATPRSAAPRRMADPAPEPAAEVASRNSGTPGPSTNPNSRSSSALPASEGAYSERAAPPQANRALLEVPTEVNYTLVKHVMRTGSSQNLQVSRWCSSFRGDEQADAPAAPAKKRRDTSAEPSRRPTWNRATKNTGWMSIEELNQDHLSNIQAQARRAAKTVQRQPYADRQFQAAAPPPAPAADMSGSSYDLPSSNSFASSCGGRDPPAALGAAAVRNPANSRIRKQLTATKQRLQASLGEAYSSY